MTEVEWFSGTDPAAMLATWERDGRVTKRTLRLFGDACWRHVQHLFPEERSEAVLTAVERYADGLAGEEEVSAVLSAGVVADERRASQPLMVAVPAWWRPGMVLLQGEASAMADLVRDLAGAVHAAANDPHAARRAPPGDEVKAARTAWDFAEAQRECEQRFQCHLLRDIFGNPFHPQPSLDTSRLTPAVQARAALAYEERVGPGGTLDPTRLADLAEALEQAGGCSAELLWHLRGPGPHVRGCWAVDLIRGRM